jgi:hypothetical protein
MTKIKASIELLGKFYPTRKLNVTYNKLSRYESFTSTSKQKRRLRSPLLSVQLWQSYHIHTPYYPKTKLLNWQLQPPEGYNF